MISICLIGKNEENYIERCLKAISGLQLPIVYTDTGSTDRTVEIASRYTDRICHFEWCNDFSKARNFCAMQAPTEWIWFMDCDERVTDIQADALLDFCARAENSTKIGTICQKDSYLLSGQPSYTSTRLGRIYHRGVCHYTGAVHEQISPIDSQAAVRYFDLPIYLEHDGYNDPKILRQKCERNAALLTQSIASGEDPYLYYQLGKCYATLDKPELAAQAFGKGLEFDVDPSLYYVQSMVESYGYCLLELKQYEAALSFEGIYDTFAVSADFVFLMGLIYMNNAFFEKAIAQFEKAATFQTSVVDGTNSYRAFYNIGVIYECLGQTKEAEIYYRKCGDFEPALARLEVLNHG